MDFMEMLMRAQGQKPTDDEMPPELTAFKKDIGDLLDKHPKIAMAAGFMFRTEGGLANNLLIHGRPEEVYFLAKKLEARVTDEVIG